MFFSKKKFCLHFRSWSCLLWAKIFFLFLLSARARARARPSRAGGLRPLPRKGTGDLPDGARAFIFDRSFFRNWPVQVIRRFFILLEIEYVNATEGKSKELKYFFIWPIFRPQSLTIYNDEMGSFSSNLVRWIEHFSALDSAFPAFWRCNIWNNESTWQRIMQKFSFESRKTPPLGGSVRDCRSSGFEVRKSGPFTLLVLMIGAVFRMLPKNSRKIKRAKKFVFRREK